MVQQTSRAGSSSHAHHISTASSASFRSSTSQSHYAPPTPTSPTHVQAIHDFDPSLLASTSTSQPSNMYLSFKAGEVIRVYVRDQTGWWDGEVSVSAAEEERTGPRRGWFPSNYVKVMGWEASSKHDRSQSSTTTSTSPTKTHAESSSISSSAAGSHSRHQSSTTHLSQASTHSIPGKTNPISPSTRSAATLPPKFQTLLHPIVQSLSLLETAIHSNRKPHIQPATACVISSIRSALMQSDCLSKESPTLAAWPILAKERKIVLVELSKLVACARRASGALDGDNGQPLDEAKEMDALAKAARGVFASLKRFLHLAADCGVEPTLSEPAIKGAGGLPTPTSNPQPPSAFNAGSMRRAQPRQGSGSNQRIQEAFRMKAASSGDLRAARKKASSPPPPLPSAPSMGQSASHGPARVPGTTPLSATFGSSSDSGRSSPMSLRSIRDARKPLGSIDSSFSHRSQPSSDAEHGSYPWTDDTPLPTPLVTSQSNRQLGSISDVHDAIGLAEDGLLSIIAAFIGHIHSHHLGSHPSSHANLIEMTRETIDAVRELLTIVEAVGRHAGVRNSRPREIEALRQAKDQLYEVASRLVEGAERVANAPFAEGGEEGYDVDKAKLLQTATGTLRAGTECVRLVKVCVPDEASTPSLTATPRQGDGGHARQLTPRPHHDGPVVLREKPVGQRGVHTLSGLHRKATSLSNLQRKYQADGALVQAPKEEDEGDSEEGRDEDEESEEFVADLSREEDLTLRPTLAVSIERSSSARARPPFLHLNTSPVAIPSAPYSADALGSFAISGSTPFALPRSRSNSLTSPAPPPRMQHRSPSRSADLDKFTGDFDIPRRPSQTDRSSSYTATTATSLSSQVSETTRSSGASDRHSLLPQTPHTYTSDFDATSLGVAQVSLDDVTPVKGKSLTLPLQRPSGLLRANTSPLLPSAPSANTDIRFWVVAHDYDPREITFNPEGSMIGASLSVLVEKMTPHDGPVEQSFWNSFFFTFRLFTSPTELLEATIKRYDLQPPAGVLLGERETAIWMERKVVPVRLRIYNFLKAWLDSFWRAESDDVVLERFADFARDAVTRTLPAMGPRLLDSVRKRQAGKLSHHSRPSTDTTQSLKRSSSNHSLRGFSQIPASTALPPTPIISKSLHSLLQKAQTAASISVPLTDFDTLELARQLTIMESKLFALVRPEDLLQTGRRNVPELKALSNMSNQVTGWVADSVLNEKDAKKRAGLLKFFIKLADKCLTLNNFSTMFAVLAGLNSSIVLRLKKTWDALSSKYRVMMSRLQGVIEHTKNHAAYRQRLREVQGPCLPFLGLILTDITFTSDGNADTRPSVLAPEMSLINQDKYAKLGKIALDFKRYQEPFNFHELEAVQTFLRRVLAERGSGSLDALYRKSLMLEPRQTSEKITSNFEKPGWLGGKV